MIHLDELFFFLNPFSLQKLRHKIERVFLTVIISACL